ncbi:folliculin-interacting protein 1-like [Ptychodera flava]|uniref:folliculin-interacting protein 1-like n=1 Tax=Ptychodera flava TaxID=63121 RepID=UPI003969EDF8
MALVKKIFQRERKFGRSSPFSNSKSTQNYPSPESLVSEKSWNAPDFDASQIRALVFIENGLEGRRLIFDSKTIKKIKKEEKSCCINKTHLAKSRTTPKPENASSTPTDNANTQPQYQIGRKSGDVTMLEEMVYGSLPMSSKGTTVKVHVIRQPPELMLSKVFTIKNQRESQIEQENLGGDDVSLSSSEFSIPQAIKNNNRSSDKSSVAHSLPMEMPTSPLKHYKSNNYDDDSGIVRSASTSSFATPYPSPGTSVSSTTSNSLQRRYMRHQATTMDFRRRSTELSGTNSSVTSDDSSLSRRRKQKIGLSIIISLCSDKDDIKNRQFQTFFFSHFPLFEHHFYKLGIEVEKSIHQKNTYITAILKAVDSFRNGIRLLYTAPRIQEPVWLNMTTCYNQHGQLCDKFMRQLVLALDQYENKNTNFFVSRLVTAVLMNHLAWVPTVTPSGVAPSQLYLAKHSSNTLDLLAKSHPYNPLWAQLGDLYGALGVPLKTAKTVVVGKNSEVVCRLLYILSYFIRCSEVHENVEKRQSISEEDMLGADTPMFERPLDFEGSEFVMVDLLQNQNLHKHSKGRRRDTDCSESSGFDNDQIVGNHGKFDVESSDGDSGFHLDELNCDVRNSFREETVAMDTSDEGKHEQMRIDSDKVIPDQNEDITKSKNQTSQEEERDDSLLPSNEDATEQTTQETEEEDDTSNNNLQNDNSEFKCRESPVSCTEHKIEHLISVGKS